MRTLTPALAALLLLPALSAGQFEGIDTSGFKFKKSDEKAGIKSQLKSEGVKGREVESAWDLVEDEKIFGLLNARDKEIILRAIIAKMHEVEAINDKAGYKKKELKDVDFKTFQVAGADFKKASEMFPQAYCVKETPGKTGKPTSNTEWQVKSEEVPGVEFHKFFADNDYKLERGRPEVKALQQQLDDAAKELAPTDPDDPSTKGFITRVQIKSSASALRNTGDIPDWLELSKARALEAKKFVTDYLRDTHGITVVIDDEKDLDYFGDDGEGVSGPSGPFRNDKQIYKNGVLTQPYQAGPEGSVHDQYEKHKYVQVTLELSRWVKVPTTKVTTPQPTVDSQMAAMEMEVVSHKKTPSRTTRHVKRVKKYRWQRFWTRVKCIFTIKDECSPFKC